MRKRDFKIKIITGLLFGLLPFWSISAKNAVTKTTRTLLLGETSIKINVYENNKTPITFFVPHHNEQTGLKIVKDLLETRGGRLIEVDSLDTQGNPVRRLSFTYQGKNYSVDPNRIFTENGRACDQSSSAVSSQVKNFADNLLKILLPPDGGKLPANEKFLVAVHNNGDVDAPGKTLDDRAQDLTAQGYVKKLIDPEWRGVFSDQSAGVYLSNQENDLDNFFFLSSPGFLGFLAGKGFNTIVQKPAAELQSKDCKVDDGSLSVYFGQKNLQYINIEADLMNGASRQRQMIEAVYELSQKTINTESVYLTGQNTAGGRAEEALCD